MGGATNLDAPQVVPMPWGKHACDQGVESSEYENQTIPQELQLQRKSLFLVVVLQVFYIDVVSTWDILVNAAKNDRCASVNNPVPVVQKPQGFASNSGHT
jgi:hypothetical protein